MTHIIFDGLSVIVNADFFLAFIAFQYFEQHVDNQIQSRTFLKIRYVIFAINIQGSQRNAIFCVRDNFVYTPFTMENVEILI